MVDDVPDPYVLLGTFSYPQPGVVPKSFLYRWNFISNKLTRLLTINAANSIRTLIRFRNQDKDLLFFSTQIDAGAAQFLASIYIADMNDVSTKDSITYITKQLQKDNLGIFATV
jgi:hypothetical protein